MQNVPLWMQDKDKEIRQLATNHCKLVLISIFRSTVSPSTGPFIGCEVLD